MLDFVEVAKNVFQTLLEFIVIAIYELLKECISSDCFSLDTIVHKPGKLESPSVHVNSAELFHYLRLLKWWY